MEEVVAEARELAADGVRELVIVAQDTTYYGMDLYGEPRLAELLRELEQVEGLDWIRLMYFYPMYVTDELIDTIAGVEADRAVSRHAAAAHQRPHAAADAAPREPARDGSAAWRSCATRIPNLVMRTTFITGFPGETDAEFDELVEFVGEQRFERLGVFTYSFEPDTPAARLPDHVPEEVKEERRERLDGGAAGNCVRVERRADRPAARRAR